MKKYQNHRNNFRIYCHKHKLIGVIFTDGFERSIEEYKKELMKYAQKNGIVYSGNENGFKTAEQKNTSSQHKQIYNEKYVNSRPMPDEFKGDIDDETRENKQEIKDLKTYKEFMNDNVKTGRLRVQAYASAQVFPIQNAKVTVEKEFSDGTFVFADEYTDIDGVAQNINLPTKSKELSLSPEYPIPYSTYTIKVNHPQFETTTFLNVPIFEGIESLQPVAMLPLSNRTDSSDIINEES